MISLSVAAAMEVVSEPRCQYMTCTRSSSNYCGNCGRVLCDKCRKGLGCLARPPKCHSRPDGQGVR